MSQFPLDLQLSGPNINSYISFSNFYLGTEHQVQLQQSCNYLGWHQLIIKGRRVVALIFFIYQTFSGKWRCECDNQVRREADALNLKGIHTSPINMHQAHLHGDYLFCVYLSLGQEKTWKICTRAKSERGQICDGQTFAIIVKGMLFYFAMQSRFKPARSVFQRGRSRDLKEDDFLARKLSIWDAILCFLESKGGPSCPLCSQQF